MANYTKPNDPDHQDSPQDWLNSAMLFASALGHVLKENEGVIIDIKNDVQMEGDKVIVYRSDRMVHILPTETDQPEGTMVWMQDPEKN